MSTLAALRLTMRDWEDDTTMQDEPKSTATGWWSAWIVSTTVLPALCGYGTILAGTKLNENFPSLMLLSLILSICCFSLMCLSSQRAIAPKKGVLLFMILLGGIILQISTGFFGCLAGLEH
jgi:hypothetical protein